MADLPGHITAVRLLSAHTSPKTQRDLERGTLLGAAKGADPSAASLRSLLLSDAAAAGRRDFHGRVPLHYLCCSVRASPAALSLLAEADADTLVAADHEGNTPLLYLLGGGVGMGAAVPAQARPKTRADFPSSRMFAEYASAKNALVTSCVLCVIWPRSPRAEPRVAVLVHARRFGRERLQLMCLLLALACARLQVHARRLRRRARILRRCARL